MVEKTRNFLTEANFFILTLHDHYCANVHHNNHGLGHQFANCDDYEFDFLVWILIVYCAIIFEFCASI